MVTKRCDHKFVDSKCCLKCGWTPTADDFAALMPPEPKAAEATAGLSRAALQTLKTYLATALTGYVQHKPGCEVTTWALGPGLTFRKMPPCTCGLRDLLTPAPPGEPEKLK